MSKRRKISRKPGKRKLGRDKIYMPEWIELKPYDRFTSYDTFYVKTANAVWDTLKSYHKDWFAGYNFGKEDYKKLSLFMTNHFEDFISDIGLWNVFRQRCHELYDTFLPFYDMEGYEDDYLNPQDFSFLLWYFLNQHTDKLFAPDAPFILDLGIELYNLLEAKIDTAPETDFYNDFFNIPDTIDFFDLKQKLFWLCSDAYVPGFEFSIELKDEIQEFTDKNIQNEPDREKASMMSQYLPTLFYAVQSDYAYKKRSSLLALSTLEWFAELTDCSESMKAQILGLEKRIMSDFLYKEENETHYYLHELYSDQRFEVNIESTTLSSELKEKNMSMNATIYPWNGEWWVSGMVMGLGDVLSEEKLARKRKDYTKTPFYAYPLHVQQTLETQSDNLHVSFLKYFGKPFVIFPDSKTAHDALKNVFDLNNAEHAKGEKTPAQEKLIKEKNIYEDLEEHLGKDRVALMSVAKQGNMFSSYLPEALDLLQSPVPINYEEAIELFHELTHECPPPILEYLLKTYPMHHVRFPVYSSQIEAEPWLPFLSRYYNPNSYSTVDPSTRALPGSY